MPQALISLVKNPHLDHTYTPSTFLKSTNTQPLHVRRLKQTTCCVFKIVNKVSVNQYIHDLAKIKKNLEKETNVPGVNTTMYGLRSFRSEAAMVWNSLPNEVRLVESYPHCLIYVCPLLLDLCLSLLCFAFYVVLCLSDSAYSPCRFCKAHHIWDLALSFFRPPSPLIKVSHHLGMLSALSHAKCSAKFSTTI